MVRKSPDKMSNHWTKHTSYPTAKNGKIPSELNMASRANNKLAEQELDMNKTIMNSIQRKSIHMLDSQKKLLEKSMLAYSEKMKEINNSKTNELFREIHTRNATRSDVRIKSPTSVSGRSNFSLPARLQPAASHPVKHRKSYCGSLRGFKNVNIPTPIPEGSSRGSTAEIRQNSGKIFSPASSQLPGGIINARFRNTASAKRRRNTVGTLDGDNMSTKSEQTYTRQSPQKVCPRVVLNSLPWMTDADGSGSDSAYSSASEDLDADSNNSPRDLNSQMDNEDNIDQQSEFVLTIPKIHVRKRNKKSSTEGHNKANTCNDLRRQVVLHQARACL